MAQVLIASNLHIYNNVMSGVSNGCFWFQHDALSSQDVLTTILLKTTKILINYSPFIIIVCKRNLYVPSTTYGACIYLLKN